MRLILDLAQPFADPDSLSARAGHPATVALRGKATAEASCSQPDEDWLRVTSVPLSCIVFSASQVSEHLLCRDVKWCLPRP
jgi:hypothetical protein